MLPLHAFARPLRRGRPFPRGAALPPRPRRCRLRAAPAGGRNPIAIRMPLPQEATRRGPASRWWCLAVLLLAAALGACVGAAPAAGPYPAYAEFQGREVKRVRFEGDLKVGRDTLDAVVSTRATFCQLAFLPVCLGKFGRRERELDLSVLQRDVVRIGLLYRDHGYYGTRVVPVVEPVDDERVEVRFEITPGDLVTLRSLAIEDDQGILDTAALRKRLPLEVGEPFSRIAFLASADTVRDALLDRGHAYAQVLRNYQIDTIADVANVTFQAAPGPLVRVDSIIIVGNDRLKEPIARRQLSFGEGDVLRTRELVRSQRALYEMELVSFASVEVAPDTMQLTPDSLELDRDTIGSTVLVRIVEAPRYLVDVSGGYGTVDCIRASASHVDRSFLGGGRRLQVSGSVSKVGVGGPADLGLGSICKEVDEDRFADTLNYRLALDFLQPRFLGTRTSVVASAHTERISELGLYLRDSHGAQLGFVRAVAPQTLLSGTVNAQVGQTEAEPFFFCVAFEVCVTEDIERLRRSRWTNSLSLGLVRNRARAGTAPYPVGGYTARATVDAAGKFLLSDDEYLRLTGEVAKYREIRTGISLSGRLMVGTFLSGVLGTESGYIPPERRFYAGGPSSVRGFERNALGPTVYVQRPENEDGTRTIASATGGERTAVASVELSAPSPVWRQYLRVAGFVDAGQVWGSTRPETREEIRRSASTGLRVTPGAGLRIATPVGPIRLDVGYNPYPPERGPLYGVQNDTLFLIDPSFRPVRRSGFRDRLTFHVAVGNAF